MDNLYEDLHWLLLISGYLLADESNGETPLIPQEIISYSSSLKAQVDIQTTFQTLCASQNQNQGKYCGGICFTTLLNLRVKILENSVCRMIIFQSEENCNCSRPFLSSSDKSLSSQMHTQKKEVLLSLNLFQSLLVLNLCPILPSDFLEKNRLQAKYEKKLS